MVCNIASHVQGGAGEKILKIYVSYMLVSQQEKLAGRCIGKRWQSREIIQS